MNGINYLKRLNNEERMVGIYNSNNNNHILRTTSNGILIVNINLSYKYV